MWMPLILGTQALGALGALGPAPWVAVSYEDSSEGHYQLGVTVGQQVGPWMRATLEGDPELSYLLSFTQQNATGQKLFKSLVKSSTAAFPMYSREVDGMAEGSGIDLVTLLVNQLREELLIYLPSDAPVKRRGHCTTVYAFDKEKGVAAMAHNDDWMQNWREVSYYILATVLNSDKSVKMKWSSWVYPGYLPGVDINFNSHGVAFTANSLFPVQYLVQGVGTAWIMRHMLESNSVQELLMRATDRRAAAAMSYNVGNISSGEMMNIEANAGGHYVAHHVTGPDFHVNQFIHTDVPQYSEESSTCRTARWNQLKPNTVPAVRQFLSDQTDPKWKVYRNHTAPDDCYTEITGLFDFKTGKLSIWRGTPADSSPPIARFHLSGPHAGELLHEDVIFM